MTSGIRGHTHMITRLPVFPKKVVEEAKRRTGYMRMRVRDVLDNSTIAVIERIKGKFLISGAMPPGFTHVFKRLTRKRPWGSLFYVIAINLLQLVRPLNIQ